MCVYALYSLHSRSVRFHTDEQEAQEKQIKFSSQVLKYKHLHTCMRRKERRKKTAGKKRKKKKKKKKMSVKLTAILTTLLAR